MSNRRLFIAVLVVSAWLAAERTAAENTDGKVTFTVTTANYSAKYAPKHVSAVWVVNGGTFVKTLSRFAKTRVNYLTKWIADRGSYTAVDGVASATYNLQPHTQTVVWDCRNTSGQVAADGAYIFRAEYTSNNGQGPYMGAHCQFVKGAVPVTTNFPNFSNASGQFSGLSLTYTPYKEIGVTGLAPATAAVGGLVPVVVTVTNETLNTLSFSVALTNVTGGSAMGSLPVAQLPGKAATNLTLSWNTAGLPPATYQVRAVASRLATETNLADNVLNRTITLSTATAGDIAVNGLAPTEGIVGSTVTISVSVTNKTANATGAFNVNLMTPVAGQKSISLAAFAGATVSFPWNTTGTTAGVYEARADVQALANEAYTADNTLSGLLALRAMVRDLAVSGFSIAPIVPPNRITNIVVTVSNRGEGSESFGVILRDVTAAAAVGTRTVSGLAAGASADVVFAWNTATNAGFKLGTHTLRAEISPVAGETDLINNVFEKEIVVTTGLKTNSLVAKNASWKYLDAGNDISESRWQTTDYYDGGWASGAAPLGYALGNIATTLRSAGSSDNRIRTYYLRHTFNLDGTQLAVTGRVMRAHGAVVYLNGEELFRQNIPDGPVTYDTLALAPVTGGDATNYHGFSIDVSRLRPGRNLLAAELHLSSPEDTVAGFALELLGVSPVISSEPRVTPVDIAAEGAAQVGDSYGIFVDLVNSGNVSTPCQVLLIDKSTGAVVASQVVDALAPGETESVKLVWKTFGAAAGAHTLQALTVINGVTNSAQALALQAEVDAPDYAPRRVSADGSVGGRCSAVAAVGRYVYLGCGATLEVWDAADPTAPVRAGLLRLPGLIEDIAAAGTRVFAACGSAGVQIIDAAAPSAMRHSATFDTSDFARRVTLDGQLLYIADALGGIRVLNVADPSAPVLAGAFRTVGPAQTVAPIASQRLLVLDAHYGLQELSSADPAAMRVSGALGRLTAGLAFEAAPGVAWASDANGWIHRIDTSLSGAPALLASGLLPAAGNGLALSGPALYVAAGQKGLLTLDAGSLALQSEQPVGDEAYDVAVAGATLYVAAGYAGCRSLDISSPLKPVPLARYDTAVRAVDAASAGSALFVAGDEAGLQVHSLESLPMPALLGRISSVSNSRCLEVSYPWAYVGDGGGGLKVLSITNAARPMLVGSYTANGLSHIRRIARSGERLVLTDGRVLQLVSVSNPFAPRLFASATNAPGSFVFDVAASGEEAYAACGGAGLRIYGLDNGLALENTFQTIGPATSVSISSNLMHVACGPYGWQTLNIGVNPVNPLRVGSTAGSAFQVAASGSQLFLSDGKRMAQALKAATSTPAARTNYPHLSRALRVRAAGGLMFVGEDEAGLSLMVPKWAPEVSSGKNVTIGSIFEMALPEAFAQAVKVTVTGLPPGIRYDAAGQRLVGVPARAGVYTVTLSAPGVAAQTVTVTVGALPAWAWGSFSGFVEGGGVASMNVTSQGKVSGKLVYGGTNYTFSAASYSGGSSGDGFMVSMSVRAGRSTVPLSLLVYRSDGAGPVSLGLAEGRFGDVRLALFRKVWQESAQVLAPFIGYYTASLLGRDGGYGSGYLTLTVDKAGQVKAAGKLADGTALSLSGTLLLDSSGRILAVLYTVPKAYKGGIFFGFAEFVNPEGGRVFVRLLDGLPFLWQSRNPQATEVYGEGFSRDVGLTGGWYDKLGNLYDYYRSRVLTAWADAAVPAPAMAVGSERYPSFAWNPVGAPLTPVINGAGVMTGLSAPNEWILQGSESASDDEEDADDEEDGEPVRSELKVSLVRATGVFSGSFRVWFDVSEKPSYKLVKFQGVLTPVREDISDRQGGGGYFLWADKAWYVPPNKAPSSYSVNASYDFRILLSAPGS